MTHTGQIKLRRIAILFCKSTKHYEYNSYALKQKSKSN